MLSPQDQLKQQAAIAARDKIKPWLENDSVIGVGTGSTVNFFIDALAEIKGYFRAAVSSSEASSERMRSHGIAVMNLNEVSELEYYVDGADESNEHLQLIKGGGAALTREKIVAAAARKFICIADESKYVGVLGEFPLPVEVIPMARSFVARKLAGMGARPKYREGVITDNGNEIIDLYNFKILNPLETEKSINNIPGVVCNGIFALNAANTLILAGKNGIKELNR